MLLYNRHTGFRRLLVALLCLASSSVLATKANLDLGLLYHSGSDTASMAKVLGYSLGYKTQSPGTLRLDMGGAIEMSSGKARLGSGTYTVRSLRALGNAGASLHPFSKFKMSPFFGFSLLCGFGLLESKTPPTDERQSRSAFHAGTEVYIGTDYVTGGERQLRLKFALRSMSSRYAGQNLDLGGLVTYLTWVFPAAN